MCNEYLLVNNENDSYEWRILKFRQAIRVLIENPSDRAVLVYLNSLKLHFDVSDSELIMLIYENIYSLTKNECDSILMDAKNNYDNSDGNRKIENLIHYLSVFTNQAYHTSKFIKQLKRDCAFMFDVLKSIIEYCDASRDGVYSEPLNSIVILILNLLAYLTLSFTNYDRDWKQYSLLSVIMKIGKHFPSNHLLIMKIVLLFFDYEKLYDKDDLFYNHYDEEKDEKKKLRRAISLLTTSSSINKLLRNNVCIKAVNYISLITQNRNMDDSKDNNKKLLVKMIFNLLRKLVDQVNKEVKIKQRVTIVSLIRVLNSEIEYQFEAKIIKKLAYMHFIMNEIVKPLLRSVEYRQQFNKQEGFIKLLFEIIENGEIESYIERGSSENLLLKNIYQDLIKSTISYLSSLITVSHLYRKEWAAYNCEALFNMVKRSKWSEVLKPSFLLNTVPYTLKYRDDEDKMESILLQVYLENLNENRMMEERTHFTDKRIIKKAVSLLVEFEYPSCVLESRKALDAIVFISNIIEDKKYIYDKSDREFMKQYIDFTVSFIKYAKPMLCEELRKVDLHCDKYQKSIEFIYKLAYYLLSLTQSLEKLAEESIDFCVLFQDEADLFSRNLVSILDLISDEYLISAFSRHHNSFNVGVLLRTLYVSCFSFLHNLSKASQGLKTIWSNLNVVQTLLNVSSQVEGIHSFFQTGTYLTVANLILKEDELSYDVTLNIIKTISRHVSKASEHLDDTIEETNKIEIVSHVDVFHSRAWHLSELLQALYKFSVDDSLKSVLFYDLKGSEWLRPILYNGNEIEQEYAFKLLYQLCFDKKILTDVAQDTELIDYMKNILSSRPMQETSKNLVNYADGILRLTTKGIDQRLYKISSKSHIMISFNSESESSCIAIKNELELMGHKVWMRTDQHGNSLTDGIENSWCVLQCVSEKYKESPDCRLEAECVLQKGKKFIPVILQKAYEPSGWLKKMIGDRKCVDFTEKAKKPFETCMHEIVNELCKVKCITFNRSVSIPGEKLVRKFNLQRSYTNAT